MDVREPMATLEIIERVQERDQSRYMSYHIAPSSLGNPCDRALWLNFRWVEPERKSARMLRLLDRGAREEKEIVKLLKGIGVDIEKTGSSQERVKVSPWILGKPDGIIRRGLAESPNNMHIAEFKTSNDKAFKELQKKGVQAAKPEHFLQMQLYMRATGIGRAFYWNVNKNTDEVYTERVKLDEASADEAIQRGETIATEPNLPGRISNDPDHFGCKFCRWHDVCYGIRKADCQRNCRTCDFCVLCKDGKVRCMKDDKVKRVTKKTEREGCDAWKLHYDLKEICTS